MLNIPDLSKRTKDMTAWQDRAMTQQSMFSMANQLGGKAITRLWGLDGSPKGDLLATIYSHDPSEIITYYVTQDYSSTLLIKPVEKSSDDTFQLPKDATFDPSEGEISIRGLQQTIANDLSGFPVESIAFSVKYWLINHDPSKRKSSGTQKEILQAVLISLNLPLETSQVVHCPAPIRTR
jgi:hypothetical protein